MRELILSLVICFSPFPARRLQKVVGNKHIESKANNDHALLRVIPLLFALRRNVCV